MLSTLIVNVLVLGTFCYSQTNVTVTTSKGTVVGLRWEPNPASSVSYDAFLGVPYGTVPARFQPPVPRPAWSTPLLAHRDGPACPQPYRPYSEDCLYLNVFTPVNASLTPGLLPVMAFIHGSAFTAGTSSSRYLGPDLLVTEGVILVTLNYRLGAAGFLTLGSPMAPGNLGIHDTSLALQWIQDEITQFGGDPRQVTLFGQSAGSAITQFHYISPNTSGLFKHAIAHSGSALADCHMLPVEEAVRRAKILAEAVGCNPAVSEDLLLSCLQRADINLIVSKQNISVPIESLAAVDLRFRPIIDTSFAKPPFFTDSLDNLMKEAHRRAKPLMTGFVKEDGIVIFSLEGDIWKLAEDNLRGFIPRRLQGSLSQSQKSQVVSKIRSRYFPDSVDQNKILDLVRLYSDTTFIYPGIEFARHFANLTYGYVFSYKGPWNPMPGYFSRFQVTGAYHGIDLSYLLYSSQDLSTCPLNLPSLRVRDNMVKWWTTFAKTGMPDPTESWRTLSNGQYLHIDSSVSVVNSSEVEDLYYNFWAQLKAENNSATTTVHGLDLLVFLLALSSLICKNLLNYTSV